MRQVLRRAVAAQQRRMRNRTSQRSLPVPEFLEAQWERVLKRLLKHGRASVGNTVELIGDGDDAMEAMWSAMASARHSIAVEMYIIEPDRVGLRTLAELAQAASRGVSVSLLMDAVGSSHITEAHLQPLRHSGRETVHIAWFNPLRPWRWPARRTHRKIVIVDGSIGFCGGMNLSEDYAGTRHGNGMFHDCIVRLRGPCVRDLHAVFVRSWRSATQRKLPALWKRLLDRGVPRRSIRKQKVSGGDALVQVQESNGAYGRRSIQHALRLTIRKAVTHCDITTPYFIPPLRLMRVISAAAKRGVDVRILTAGKSDVPTVRLASQHIYGQLLRHGVRIYEMQHPVLHAKTIEIDGVYATVGSFNLDTWSDKRNLECNVAIIDHRVAGEMHEVFMGTISRAEEMTLETWHGRGWKARATHWLAYHLMRL